MARALAWGVRGFAGSSPVAPTKNMKYNRRSIRLRGYDYSNNGVYFITICTQNRECLFGKIVDNEIVLNKAGQIINDGWIKLKNEFLNIESNEYIVMPNHFHGIITVGAPLVGAQNRAGTRPAPTVGDIVGTFKSLTTNKYIQGVKSGDFPLFNKRIWQRNYHEHIIRNEKDLYPDFPILVR